VSAAFVCGIMFSIVLVIIGYALGKAFSDSGDDWEKKCVEAGVAEYYLDEDGDRQWRFKTKAKTEAAP